MRVSVGDVRLFFDVEGSGLVVQKDSMAPRPVLILLHGGPGADHSLFKPEFSAITDAAQVVYVDQRGSGRSDRGEPRDWTWQKWADDIANLCEALGITDPVLVGSSGGGLVAMVCAARHPDLVAGLVLDSTFGTATTLEQTLEVFERRGGSHAREAARRYLGGDMTAEAAADWERYALPLYATADDGDLAVRRARALINDEVQAHFRRGGCGPADATAHVAAITCPTLILAGADDPMSPAAGAAGLAESMVNATVQLEVFPDTGHGVFRQRTEEAMALLRAFLQRVAERG